jgi:hypothetical protein
MQKPATGTSKVTAMAVVDAPSLLVWRTKHGVVALIDIMELQLTRILVRICQFGVVPSALPSIFPALLSRCSVGTTVLIAVTKRIELIFWRLCLPRTIIGLVRSPIKRAGAVSGREMWQWRAAPCFATRFEIAPRL